MEKMYKSLVGWVEWKPGDEKHRPIHRLLTAEEYDGLRMEVQELRQRLDNERREKVRALAAEQQRTEAAIQKAQADAQAECAAMAEKLRQAEAERDYQTRLNANLLRISKERSNADRKLKPKKTHTGYIVLQSRQKEQHFVEQRRPQSRMVWETTLQTPYPVDFTEEQARTQISRDMRLENAESPLRKIGITDSYTGDVNRLMASRESGERNVVYGITLRADYRAGYWAVIYTHTAPLGGVPGEMKK